LLISACVKNVLFVPVLGTIKYYEEMAHQFGGLDRAQQFSRLYPVPNMGHCSGGPATDQFDLLTPLANWVVHALQNACAGNETRASDNSEHQGGRGEHQGGRGRLACSGRSFIRKLLPGRLGVFLTVALRGRVVNHQLAD
jgi:hypothetical protein